MSTAAQALLRLAERAAARAAAWLREARPPIASDWAMKGQRDWVTEVDRGTEERIRDTLLTAEPGSTILGEELSPEESGLAGLVWIVDPLDGTANFLHHYPWWGVSIAAAIDGELVAGTVVDVPGMRRCSAWAGGGAWDGGQRLRVSGIDVPAHAMIGTGLPFKRPEEIPRYLAQLELVLPATSGVRRAGSAALDLASVARGHFEAFWELTLAPWDVAAGMLLIREAGGVVTDLEGHPATIRHGGLVAGNPSMHAWLLETINSQ